MSTLTIKDKHLKLNQKKIDRAREILGAKTETETIETALDMIIQKSKSEKRRREVVEKILMRRKKMGIITEDVNIWLRDSRAEREKLYAR